MSITVLKSTSVGTGRATPNLPVWPPCYYTVYECPSMGLSCTGSGALQWSGLVELQVLNHRVHVFFWCFFMVFRFFHHIHNTYVYVCDRYTITLIMLNKLHPHSLKMVKESWRYWPWTTTMLVRPHDKGSQGGGMSTSPFRWTGELPGTYYDSIWILHLLEPLKSNLLQDSWQ